MKKRFLIGLVLLVTIFSCKESGYKTIVDEKIALKDLKEDFTYFRLILEAVHPGLYLYNTKKQMDRRFDSLYMSLNSDATISDFYNRLSILINSVHCGHTSIYTSQDYTDSIHKIKGYFPVPLNVVNDELRVNSEDFEIPLGAEIVSINKEKIKKILPLLWNYEPVDGYNKRYQQEEGAWDFATNYFMLRGPQQGFVVGYKKDDSSAVEEVVLEPKNYAGVLEASRYFALAEDVNYDMEMYEQYGYAILTIYTFGYDTWSTDNAFENFINNSFKLLKKTPGVRNLIIDLRNNTGGNFHDMFHLYGYLTHKAEWKEFNSAYTVFNRIPFLPYLATGDNDVSGVQASIDSSFTARKVGRYVKEYTSNETMYQAEDVFKGNVFALINSNVQSAAAYFAALLKDEGHTKIIGDETGGSGTNTNSFHLLTYELPHSKIKISLPVVHAEYVLENNRHSAGHGVSPDYPVSLSLSGLKENTDNQMNFIIDSLIR